MSNKRCLKNPGLKVLDEERGSAIDESVFLFYTVIKDEERIGKHCYDYETLHSKNLCND